MNHDEITSQHYFDLLDGAEHWAINQVVDEVIELEIKNAKLREHLRIIHTVKHIIMEEYKLNRPIYERYTINS